MTLSSLQASVKKVDGKFPPCSSGGTHLFLVRFLGLIGLTQAS